ncbi:DUF3301 domain-containing protein [Moritella sp.]|uniref:DUF3301 domain-containing protein n=1 Tax=Moritella sp. TaxID=78556 RepID=UPI001DEACCEE|nr:DUF3301 domain-containing protein [Moritella sp.]MCJ8351115.1 DUF3301 domain-containing protein [Moritella sp.]NQZ41597.1 DUF3301 domain-containing protein [Moritella sp.]
MGSLLVIVVGFIGVVIFSHLRKQAELANALIKQYCQQQQLQWLSTAQAGISWYPHKGSLFRYKFNFEFSSNGENAYQACLVMAGPTVLEFIVPPYAID